MSKSLLKKTLIQCVIFWIATIQDMHPASQQTTILSKIL